MTTTSLAIDHLHSPVGWLRLRANEHALLELQFCDAKPGGRRRPNAITEQTRRQLVEYFAGERTRFDLLLAPEGAEFSRRVWTRLLEIPYGATTSYGAIATALGKPGAARAVGLANGRNPIAIVIPCHRVIGSDGSLTGYGGGMPRKTWLLDHERSHAPARPGATLALFTERPNPPR